MRDALKNLHGKEILFEDGSCFLYTINPYEMKNSLGAVAAVLDEYSFTKKGSIEAFKLYRTKEGNWYDLSEENKDADKAVLLWLKLSIEKGKIDSK